MTFVGERTGEYRTENGFLGLVADADNDPLVDWIRSAHPTTRFTTSACTGSLVLAGWLSPQPPFDAGSVEKAGDDIMARVLEYAADKD